MKKVNLPNNGFGVAIMLSLMLLIPIVSFNVTYWLLSMIGPWWVSLPTCLFVAIFTFARLVKFKS